MAWLRDKLRKGIRREPQGPGADVERAVRELRNRLTEGRLRLMAAQRYGRELKQWASAAQAQVSLAQREGRTPGDGTIHAAEEAAVALAQHEDAMARLQDMLEQLQARVLDLEAKAAALLARRTGAQAEVLTQDLLDRLRYGAVLGHLERLEADVAEVEAHAAAVREVAQWQIN